MHPKYSYRRKFEEILRAKQRDCQHSLLIGASASGKNHLAFYMLEEALKKRYAKLYYFCWDWQHLQEVMTLLFSAKKDPKLYRRTSVKPNKGNLQFPMRIYLPISENMPHHIFEGLNVPFTVSIDNLPLECIQIMCGNTNCSPQWDEYKSIVKKGMTLPDLKKEFLLHRSADALKEEGFFGNEWTVSHASNATVQQGLIRRLATLDKEGIVANQDYRFALEKLMEKEIKDPDTICVLYLGAVNNPVIRKFCYIYFYETLRAKLEQNNAEKFDYKNIFYHNEIESWVMPTNNKNSTDSDMVINQYLMNRASTGRHINLEIWADLKSMDLIDTGVLSLFVNKFVTRLDSWNDQRKIGEMASRFGEKQFRMYVHHLTYRKNHKKIYRFVDLGGDMPMWIDRNQREMGFELARPRITFDGKIDMKYNEFSYIFGKKVEEVLGLDKNSKHSSHELKKELRDLWVSGDKELEAYMASQAKKKEKTKKATEEEEGETKMGKNERLKLIVKLKQENPDWTHAKLGEIIGVSEKTILRDAKEIKKLGLNKPVKAVDYGENSFNKQISEETGVPHNYD